MRQHLAKYGVLLALALAVAACRQQPVYNVDYAPVQTTAQLSAAQVGHVIRQSAEANHWMVKQIAPTTLRCTNRWRTHVAVVDVTYTDVNYSIRLVSSENLMQENGTIHRKYNDRVRTLQNAIDYKLALLR